MLYAPDLLKALKSCTNESVAKAPVSRPNSRPGSMTVEGEQDEGSAGLMAVIVGVLRRCPRC